MIDLHIHSNNSDGTDSVEEILQKAEQLKLEYISFTDHDNCDAYDVLDKLDVKKYFSGTIIKGIELKCAYQGRLIDILGYNYDLKIMKKMLKKYYPGHAVLQEKYLKHFYNACKKMNLKLTPFDELEWNKEKDWATLVMYREIKKFHENEAKCPKDMWSSLEGFRYKYLYNTESDFYIDKSKDYPTLEECLSIIHKAKGKAFLAHIYIYTWAEDKKKFIKELVDNYKIDGIECYYTTFSQGQIHYALDVCKKNNLLISGGCDYHGENKPGIDLGIGYGNLQIPSEIISSWARRTSC